MFRYGSAILLGLVPAAACFGAQATFNVHMSWDQETTICDPGSDGTATGTITLDDVTGAVSWNFTYANIDAPTAMHIHTGAVGVPGGILVTLNVMTTGGPGTLINSTTHGTPGQLTNVINNPHGFYVNIHTAAPCGAGAVRGQIDGCDSNDDCTDDGFFCNGLEPQTCTNFLCDSGPDPCPAMPCCETLNSCVPPEECPALSPLGVAALIVLVTGTGLEVFRRRTRGKPV